MIKNQLGILTFPSSKNILLPLFFLLCASIVFLGSAVATQASQEFENLNISVNHDSQDIIFVTQDQNETHFTLTKSKSKPVLKRLLKKRHVITPAPADAPVVSMENTPVPDKHSISEISVTFSPDVFKKSHSPRAP